MCFSIFNAVYFEYLNFSWVFCGVFVIFLFIALDC